MVKTYPDFAQLFKGMPRQPISSATSAVGTVLTSTFLVFPVIRESRLEPLADVG